MDKFGSHSRKRMPIWRMLQDLDMNDNRITSLGLPRDSSDAVTKRWVNLQLKDGVKAIDELEVELGATQKSIEAEKKRLDRIEKEMVKCLPTAGGEMNGDIDMRGHAIRNLSKGTEAGEPVTKGWYAKNWQELVANMQVEINAAESKYKTLENQMFVNQEKIDALETFIKLKHHTTDRVGRRSVSDLTDYERTIDAIKKVLPRRG
ncbi:Hypothetical predicted protein [Mytilus galloprovincialis]|uniref:Uncharacterized protein n=2 Tax=Mytilus galloprovincialis TaxID=29158 RepID=A0A8B6HM65_MYTGA|nr:Hypothetical predicted protein [Mytilus galloprovincialis]VDI81880.1 Hypothetical predicted protein [Mytilus galloprovincialis]